jgi:hypothetical protein
MATSDGNQVYKDAGDYSIKFGSDNIAGNYTNRAIMPPVVPKNELAEKQAWATWAKDKIVSRTTAYERIGIESPEDEKALLMLEMGEPVLNPDGISTLMQAQQPLQVPNGQSGAVPPPALNAPPLKLPAGQPSGT